MLIVVYVFGQGFIFYLKNVHLLQHFVVNFTSVMMLNGSKPFKTLTLIILFNDFYKNTVIFTTSEVHTVQNVSKESLCPGKLIWTTFHLAA